ncbi:hypothetical protein OG21DRAFT_851711 [Imleria badia]|nr:hypothetical protein OG21DRAFT_851711 [Imleria badia]
MSVHQNRGKYCNGRHIGLFDLNENTVAEDKLLSTFTTRIDAFDQLKGVSTAPCDCYPGRNERGRFQWCMEVTTWDSLEQSAGVFQDQS